MTSALLSLLIPSAVAAEGKAGDMPRSPLDALPADVGSGFGQMLAAYQLKLDVKQSSTPAKPGLPIQNIAQNTVPANERPITAPLVLASVMQPVVPTAANMHAVPVEKETGFPESTEETRDVPEVDASAYSLIAPVVAQYHNNVPAIAYTTDAEVAAVAVFDKKQSAPAMPAPAEAFSPVAFPELTPVAEPALPEAEVANLPLLAPAAGVTPETTEDAGMPEVNLPQMQVVTKEEVRRYAEPLSSDDSENEEDASAEITSPVMQPVTPQVMPVSGTVVPTATPLSADERADEAVVRPEPSAPLGAKAPAAEAKLPAASDGSPQGDKDGKKQDTTPDRSGIYRPLGEATEDMVKPEANLAPAAPESKDFSALMTNKTDAPAVPLQHLTNAHSVDAQRDVPTMKLAHAPVNVPVQEQIAVRIRQAKDDGMDTISIRLDPAELGKLHIKLEIAQDGRAQVVVTADNRDTLEMLRQDARGLERALADAGVKADSGSMQFDLRQQSGQNAAAGQFEFNQQQGGNARPEAGKTGRAGESASASIEPAPVLATVGDYNIVASDGVDISV